MLLHRSSIYFLYLEVLLYYSIYTYTAMKKIYYLMPMTQIILDIGFYQWSRICRIIVDETQKEWRLNWTFVDKFFVGIFLKKIWWMGWKIDGCNSPNLGGLCAISALKLFFKWMDLKQVSTFLMIIKTGYFLFYHLKIIKIWFTKYLSIKSKPLWGSLEHDIIQIILIYMQVE